MEIHTESGSVYKIDQDNKTICRLSGNNNPTPRQGKDHMYRKYDYLLTGIEVGQPIVIVWYVEDGIAKSTMTSNVVKILE